MNRLTGTLVVALAGGIAGAAFSGTILEHRVMGQTAPPPPPKPEEIHSPRFVLKVWSTPPAGGGVNYGPEHGAYRLDTETGEVVAVQGDQTGVVLKAN
jgi:hypothetical protein